jgi:DNA polymerase III alpha subunit
MYVELHAASAFSFLEGASLPEELAAAAARMEMPAMALLDRDGVYGAPRFYQACREAGLRPHVGAEITGVGGLRYPLLVETAQGYRNLCRLVTLMKMRVPKGGGAVTSEELAEHAPGLVCLTGDAGGPLAAALGSGGLPVARRCLEQLRDIFGPNGVYVELQRHQDRAEEARLEASVAVAREQRLPILATNGVRYVSDREVLDVFTAIRNHRTLETAGRLLSKNDARVGGHPATRPRADNAHIVFRSLLRHVPLSAKNQNSSLAKCSALARIDAIGSAGESCSTKKCLVPCATPRAKIAAKSIFPFPTSTIVCSGGPDESFTCTMGNRFGNFA